MEGISNNDDGKYRDIFGSRLKFIRKVLVGMSQEEFAAKMDLDSGQSFVSKVERGERLLSVENIYRAADVLGVHPAVLMSTDEFTDEQLEMLVNLFTLFRKNNKDHILTIKGLLETYTK